MEKWEIKIECSYELIKCLFNNSQMIIINKMKFHGFIPYVQINLKRNQFDGIYDVVSSGNPNAINHDQVQQRVVHELQQLEREQQQELDELLINYCFGTMMLQL